MMWWFESNFVIFHNSDTQLSWEQNEEIRLSGAIFPVVGTLSGGIWSPPSLPPSLPPYQSPYLPHDSNSSLMIKFSKHENIWMNTLHYEYEKNNLIDERLETSSSLMIPEHCWNGVHSKNKSGVNPMIRSLHAPIW